MRAFTTSGSSPLARGTGCPMKCPRRTQRFIPAGAGNSIGARRRRDGKPVHPRWRGEQNTTPLHASNTAGSSPLARGTVQGRFRASLLSWFIPAGAGNSIWSLQASPCLSVHPRWRGEQGYAPGAELFFCGSSPLARGTGWPGSRRSGRGRFIPAGAGNRGAPRTPRCAPPVHPRWRGEQMCQPWRDPQAGGSSPLARGTDQHQGASDAPRRFIPAGAGNSVPPAESHRCTSVHPRWRGEQPRKRSGK